MSVIQPGSTPLSSIPDHYQLNPDSSQPLTSYQSDSSQQPFILAKHTLGAENMEPDFMEETRCLPFLRNKQPQVVLRRDFDPPYIEPLERTARAIEDCNVVNLTIDSKGLNSTSQRTCDTSLHLKFKGEKDKEGAHSILTISPPSRKMSELGGVGTISANLSSEASSWKLEVWTSSTTRHNTTSLIRTYNIARGSYSLNLLGAPENPVIQLKDLQGKMKPMQSASLIHRF